MMKQESKIKRIFQAFTEESDIPKELQDERRSICDICPFNSKNTDDDKLTLIQKQKKRIEDFCTACGCFIEKKTSRGSEACGREDIGLTPLWNRVVLKTVGTTDLDIKNHTPENCNIRLSDLKDYYEVDLFEFKTFEKSIKIEFTNEGITDVEMKPYCDCITVTKEGNWIYNIKMDDSNMNQNTNIFKTIEVIYKKDNRFYESKIILKGRKI